MYKIKLKDFEGEESVDMTLPFPPFSGLFLQAPWRNGGDFVKVGEIYWDANAQHFEVYEQETR